MYANLDCGRGPPPTTLISIVLKQHHFSQQSSLKVLVYQKKEVRYFCKKILKRVMKSSIISDILIQIKDLRVCLPTKEVRAGEGSIPPSAVLLNAQR